MNGFSCIHRVVHPTLVVTLQFPPSPSSHRQQVLSWSLELRFLGISHIWNHTILVLLHVTSFTYS